MKFNCLRKIYYHILSIKFDYNQRKMIQSLNKKSNFISNDCKISPDSIFRGKNGVGQGCVLKGTDLGYATYIGSDCYFEKTSIGKYCSIANNVRVIAGEHPTSNWVSTHPAFYSKMSIDRFGYVKEQLFDEFKYADVYNKKFVSIGNDVWIGAEVSVLEGVSIGDGAIIAAKSLVTKDVEPFEIVGGIPAKHIRWRFEEEDRNFLLKFQWWNKSEEWIIKNAELFSDVKKVRSKYEE